MEFLPACVSGGEDAAPRYSGSPLPPPLIPEEASKNAETQNKRSSTGNSKKHQSTSQGQN